MTIFSKVHNNSPGSLYIRITGNRPLTESILNTEIQTNLLSLYAALKRIVVIKLVQLSVCSFTNLCSNEQLLKLLTCSIQFELFACARFYFVPKRFTVCPLICSTANSEICVCSFQSIALLFVRQGCRIFTVQHICSKTNEGSSGGKQRNFISKRECKNDTKYAYDKAESKEA